MYCACRSLLIKSNWRRGKGRGTETGSGKCRGYDQERVHRKFLNVNRKKPMTGEILDSSTINKTQENCLVNQSHTKEQKESFSWGALEQELPRSLFPNFSPCIFSLSIVCCLWPLYSLLCVSILRWDLFYF